MKNRKFFLFKYSSKERDQFVDNLSMLISSGMGILPSLTVSREEVRSSSLGFVVDDIIEQVESGTSLWRAVDNHKLFSGYFISLLKIGEESGRLAENLSIISHQCQKEKILRSKIQSAMMYPVFVIFLAFIIAIGVAWFILPKLASVFTNLKMDLPLVTEILINFGVFLSNEGAWVVPSFIIFIILLVFFLFFFPKTKFIGRNLLFSLPGARKVIRQVELSRFGFIVGTLLEAGLPITIAFDSLKKATTFRIYKKLYGHISKDLSEGKSFRDSFRSYKNCDKLITKYAQQMISSGQDSGNLPGMFVKISEDMENRVEITTKNLSTILEPILLVLVWMGVVLVALAVILPIYSLVGGLNEDTSTPAPPPPPIVEEDVYEEIIIEDIPIIEEEPLTPEIELTRLVISSGIGYLNVRNSPTTSGELITRVRSGEKYYYSVIDNNWYQIILDSGLVGWVSGDYIEEIE